MGNRSRGRSCRLTVTDHQLRAGANAQLYGGWPMVLSGLKTWLETGGDAHHAWRHRVSETRGEGSDMGRGLRRLNAFMQVSLDGRFADAAGDMSFAHKQAADAEWHQFTAGNAAAGGVLMFGRTTYDLMASWWPTPARPAKAMPDIARQMNALPEVCCIAHLVVSAPWSNTSLIKRDLIGTVLRMKAEPGPEITILGSGSIVTQLATAPTSLDSIDLVCQSDRPWRRQDLSRRASQDRCN